MYSQPAFIFTATNRSAVVIGDTPDKTTGRKFILENKVHTKVVRDFCETRDVSGDIGEEIDTYREYLNADLPEFFKKSSAVQRRNQEIETAVYVLRDFIDTRHFELLVRIDPSTLQLHYDLFVTMPYAISRFQLLPYLGKLK